MNRIRPIYFHKIREAVALAFLFFAVFASAHEPSKSYLNLKLGSNQITGRLDVPLSDLQNVVPLGNNPEHPITQEQIDTHYYDVTAYAGSNLLIAVDGHAFAPQFASLPPVLEEFSDGQHLPLDFVLEKIHAPQTLEIDYTLFFETNSLHRGLLHLEAGGKTQLAAFSPGHSSQRFQFNSPTYSRQFFAFVREGIWHIWTGYDHILFLLALLLPSVLQREGGRWREASAPRPVFYNVLKIVTAFTVAHSLTLSLATLGMIRLPTRFTESAIALSVALAAGNNLWPLVRERGWMVAFAFGLIHGFGFATALSDFGLTHGSLALTLVGFNVGVEIGQLAIVAVFLPIAFALRRTWFYQKPVLRLGSAFVILIASAWFAERVLDVKWMPF